jgi:PAS domain S-box-containing protein
MNESIILGLIQNTAILLAFSLIYDYSWVKDEETKKTVSKLLAGVIIGGIGIILMMTPWTLVPGILFDTRSILIAISGLFFGTIPTIVAMIIMGIYRLVLGGDGVWMGISVIITSGTIGILWKRLRPKWKEGNYRLELLIMGILVHVTMLAETFLLPWDTLVETLRAIALPLIIIYAPGTMLLGLLMVKQFNNWQNRKAKESLIESERRFTEMLNNVNMLSVILDNQGRVTFCNPYFLDVAGYSESEVIGRNWFDSFTPPEIKEEVMLVFEGFIRGEIYFTHYENEIVIKNKERILISWNNTLLRSAEGEIIGTASIGENITARRAAEEQKLRFANILEASLNEIYVFDAETLLFKYVNYGALNNLGYSLTNIKNLKLPDIQPDFSSAAFGVLIYPLTTHEKSEVIYESRNQRIDGSYYPVEVHLQLFEYSLERIFLAVVQDITNRKQAEEQLIMAKKKAEENDRLKSIFLSNMSHEIRTPMNAIIGFSELLNKPSIETDKRVLYVDIIRNSSQRLLQIINDILDISKLEAKQLVLNLDECYLSDIFRKSILAFKKSDLLLSKPEVTLTLRLPERYNDLKIVADKNRVQQVLDNLVCNAIKYSEKGSVETGFEILTDNNLQVVQVYVRDTGKGIPKGMNDLIFERFRQIEEKGFHEGAGLGLSISKGLVSLWGGRIWFNSRLNRGTTFYFTVPLGSTRWLEVSKEVEVDEMVNLRNKTILIADDDFNSFVYLKELLDGENVEILYAENGQIVMDLVENRSPDLVLLDINMPVKQGLKCLKEIQKKETKTKLIVQTAYAMAEERDRCFSAGCHGYISKPIHRNELYRLINQVMKGD